MPEKRHIMLSNCTEIHLWRITETLDWGYAQIHIDQAIETQWKSYHPSRQAELVFVRLALEHIIPGKSLHYDTDGKPHIVNDPRYISISHSDDQLGICLGKNPVGLDIEAHYTKCSTVYSKFIHPSEALYISKDDLELVGQAWCAKEAIFKAIGKKGVAFKEQIVLPTLARNRSRLIGLAFLDETNYKFQLFRGEINGIPWVVASQIAVHEAIGLSNHT